ncbi:ATPase-like protein [Leishmania mexicana MHOM/GT/2001/U1103]|uniref:ATPase-like protein n=1 Tax=Leishmania mexicana (strain MHOM/GT/2001/U1103) TaxID=929439 RepID=E9B5C4_LEIMU|nr:ATPase-like protein [Leishmania mexicana MHOM/GT/2001/U1103]CBZ30444.1 ATPase-like protein [Leishmania mexicana MHOM/GT/2001/U1103]
MRAPHTQDVMEAKKVEEARALVCHARDLLRYQLVAAPHRPLCIDEQSELRIALQQLLPCISIIRSYEQEYTYLSTYELTISALGQVLGSLVAGETTVDAEDRQFVKAKHDAEHHTKKDNPEASAILSTPTAPLGVPATAAFVPASCARQAAATASSVTWRNTYGCDDAILALRQATTLPLQHPSLFTGPRQPWRRLLLYGPPGTGKTRLAAATAAEYGAMFLSVSAADLLSKWVGESEKQVRQAFMQAAASAPRCVLFFDEVDALCSARGGHGESELARRLKTELLLHLQMDLPAVTVLAATNLPWELDAAFLRRFDRFIHVGLPSDAVKRRLLGSELRGVAHTITDDALDRIVAQTDRFSVVDVRRLLSHAVMAPVTEWLRLTQATVDDRSSDSGERAEAGSDGIDVLCASAATAPAPLLHRPLPSRTHTEWKHRSVHCLADTEVLGAGVRSVTSGTESTPSPCSSPLPSSPVGPERCPSKHSSSLPHCRLPGSHANDMPFVEYRHFEDALQAITATTSAEEIARYATWRCRSAGV